MREALQRERAAHQDLLDAEAQARELRAAWRERQKLVEEIQQEVLTGSTGRPILDRCNGAATNGDGASAAAPARSGFDLVTSRPGSVPETNGVGPGVFTGADLFAAVRAAVGWGGISERLRAGDRSPTDREILDELGDHWGTSPQQWAHLDKHCKGYRVAGGKVPKFWMGEVARASVGPTLQGDDLVAVVRSVLKLGRPAAEPPAPSKSARGRKPAAASK